MRNQRIPKNTTQKRSIFTPHPTTTALIQASFNASRPVSSRRIRSGTKNQFSTELEQRIAEQLEECNGFWDQHNVFREAFNSIINRFDNYRDSMLLIKDGYEEIINKLSNEIKEHGKESAIFMRSQNEFNIQVNQQKQTLDRKREKIKAISQQTQEQISHEINELQSQLSINQSAFKEEDETAHHHWYVMQDYGVKMAKKEEKARKTRLYYEKLEERRDNLKQAIENHHHIISKTLDDILQKDRSIIAKNKNIESLKTEIESETINARNRREKLDSLEKQKEDLKRTTENFQEEINRMNNENSEISAFLNNFLKDNSKSKQSVAEFDDPVRLTERFVLDLRPKRNVST